MPFARMEALARFQAARARARALVPRAGHDFASNDYLGLAGSARLAAAVRDAVARGVPVGAGGSRLLRGNHPEHEALEAEAAAWLGADACLYFGGGFGANVALLSALPARGDLVVHDALVHASTHDGLRAGRAGAAAFPHNDPGAAAEAIRAWRGRGGRGVPWIAVESLYSMDGDRAPIAALVEVARAHDAMLIVDEAHATGVYGRNGAGLSAPWIGWERLVTLHTAGKALGASGAIVAADRRIVAHLVNRARGFLYATAPSPLMAAAVREAIRIMADEPERRARLAELVALANARLGAAGAAATGTQIIPVPFGQAAPAVAAARFLQQAGFDCRAIRPPTVPEGTARLRLSITLNVEAATVRALAASLSGALAACPRDRARAGRAPWPCPAAAPPTPPAPPAGSRD